KVGDEPERARSGVKSKSDRIDGVVRNRETLHGNVANRKLGAGPKNPPVAVVIHGAAAADGLSRERIGVNRNFKFAGEHFQSANMIAMLMRQQHAIDLFRPDAKLLQAKNELARAESAVD